MNRTIIRFLIPLIVMLVPATVFSQSTAGGRARGSVPTATEFEITVRANVDGASVAVDGIPVKASTPAVIKVAAGKHTFTVSAPGYATYETTVDVSGKTTVNANLKSMGHRMTFQADAAGATVFLNGVQQGPAPLTVELSPGKYLLKVTAPGYIDYETTITVNRPETFTAYMLPVTWVLAVNSNVNGAQVFVNGRASGRAPFQASLPSGTYSIRVTAPGFVDFETSVLMNNNSTVTADLIPVTYRLSINSNVQGAQVFLNGQQAGTVPYSIAVPAGTYGIRLTAPGFLDFVTSIEVKADASVAANLIPANATVTVDLPQIYLDPAVKNPLKEIRIFVDGKIQGTATFQVPPGKHVIQIVSGGFSIQKEFTFESAKTYTIQPFMDLMVR